MRLRYHKMRARTHTHTHTHTNIIEWKMVEVPKKYIQNDFQKYIEL